MQDADAGRLEALHALSYCAPVGVEEGVVAGGYLVRLFHVDDAGRAGAAGLGVVVGAEVGVAVGGAAVGVACVAAAGEVAATGRGSAGRGGAAGGIAGRLRLRVIYVIHAEGRHDQQRHQQRRNAQRNTVAPVVS